MTTGNKNTNAASGLTTAAGSLTSDQVIDILEGACWTLRARFTSETPTHEDYEWVVEGCSSMEMGKGSTIHLAVQDAFLKYQANTEVSQE